MRCAYRSERAATTQSSAASRARMNARRRPNRECAMLPLGGPRCGWWWRRPRARASRAVGLTCRRGGRREGQFRTSRAARGRPAGGSVRIRLTTYRVQGSGFSPASLAGAPVSCFRRLRQPSAPFLRQDRRSWTGGSTCAVAAAQERPRASGAAYHALLGSGFYSTRRSLASLAGNVRLPTSTIRPTPSPSHTARRVTIAARAGRPRWGSSRRCLRRSLSWVATPRRT